MDCKKTVLTSAVAENDKQAMLYLTRWDINFLRFRNIELTHAAKHRIEEEVVEAISKPLQESEGYKTFVLGDGPQRIYCLL